MRTKLFVTLTALFIAITTAPLAHASECTFDRTLGVGARPVISAATGSGNIRVTVGDGSTLRIHGHARSGHSGWFASSGEGDAQAVCNRPPVEQNGDSVKIGNSHDDIYRHVAIDYEIELPRTTELTASTGSGNLDISGVQGRFVASTGSGDIRAETNASDVKATTGSGNIELSGVNGRLTANTGSGNIRAEGTPTETWRLETGSGDVRLQMASGKGFELDAQAGSGRIDVEQPITMHGALDHHHVHGVVGSGGPMVWIETGSGNIQVR